ncbi:MAG TPA: GntR family transcriptional regulator [Candidatus Elarobacter sp.]|nr:GntR family transcriptional regulator [Candidatus Elarobacter sp.]
MNLKVQSTAHALADRLREEILAGSLPAGQPLPQEELSARFGVSRSPLREALRALEAEGWIEYRPNRGAVVAGVSEHDLREVYGVRRILEAGAVRLAVARLDAATLERVRALERSMRAETDAAAFVATHRRFHLALYEAAGNARLVEAIVLHYVRVQRVPGFEGTLQELRRCCARDHRELLAACGSRDAARAERAVVTHLDHLEAIVLAQLRASKP